jgi:hypothetical protein
MMAALPAQDRVNDRAVSANDDLRDRSAQNPLARRSRRGGMRSGALNIGAEREELLLSPSEGGRREIMAAMSPSIPRSDNGLQSLVPPALQFAGYEPVGWIDSTYCRRPWALASTEIDNSVPPSRVATWFSPIASIAYFN